MPRKMSEKPGQLTGSNQIKDRVNTTVSAGNQFNLSETGKEVLRRMVEQTPENERIIRDIPLHVNPRVAAMIQEDEPEGYDRAVKLGFLVVA